MRFTHQNRQIRDGIARIILAGMPAAFLATAPWAQAPPDTIAPLNHFLTVSAAGTIQGKPGIAFDGTNFLAVWQDPRNSSSNSSDVYGTFIKRDGTVLNPTGIPIATRLGSDWIPSVAFDGTNYLVVWVAEVMANGGTEIYGARVTPGGTVLDSTPVKITTDANPKFRPISLAFDGQNYLIAWRNQTDEIRGIRVTASGASLDGGNGFNIGQGFYPWVAFNGTNYLVAWFGHGASSLDIFGARVNTNGAILPPGLITIAHDPNGSGLDQPTIASDGTDFFVAWRNADIPWQDDYQQYRNGSAYAARVSGAGVVLDTPPFKISDHTLGAYSIQAVYDGTNYFVVWHVDDVANFRNSDLFGRRVSRGGSVLDERPIPLATSYGHDYGPVIGFGADRYLVAWNNPFCGDCSSTPCVRAQMFEKGVSMSSMSGLAQARKGPLSSLTNTQAGGWSVEASNTTSRLHNIWAFDENHVYATTSANDGSVMGYNGTSWSVVAKTATAHNFGLWGLGPLDIWTVGFSFGHYNGTSMGLIGYLDCGLGMAVWGSSSNNIWATGNFSETGHGDFYHHNGTQLNRVSSGTSVDMWDIWGTASNNVYAVGEFGTVSRYDGQSWIKQSGIPTNQSLNAIWGSGPNDVFAVGDSGAIIHFDGASWTSQTSGTPENLYGVWGFDGSSVYAVGNYGTIIHYDGSHWATEMSGTNVALLDVAGAGNTVRAVGDQGVILRKAKPLAVIANVSTRLPVGTGDDVLIEGFIVLGPVGSSKKIMVRAIGPWLEQFGIPDALENPTLEIRDDKNLLIATNNNWRNTQVGGIITGDQSAEIEGSGLAPVEDLESAIIASLIPGRYTAVVRGVGNTVGTGLVDAYDMSAASSARLANISTRGLIRPGDQLMIAGFIIQNGGVKTVVRAIGPSLSGLGINNPLPDTTLQLKNANGMIVIENDDWQIDPQQKQELEDMGLQPSDPKEAALVVTIPPGQYTAQVRGKPETTGIGVVEVYFLQ